MDRISTISQASSSTAAKMSDIIIAVIIDLVLRSWRADTCFMVRASGAAVTPVGTMQYTMLWNTVMQWALSVTPAACIVHWWCNVTQIIYCIAVLFFDKIQISSLQYFCKCTSIHMCKYTKYTSIQECKYASVQEYKKTSVQVYKQVYSIHKNEYTRIELQECECALMM